MESYINELKDLTEDEFRVRTEGKAGQSQWEISDQTASFKGLTEKPLTSLDEALEFCKVDLNVWQVERHLFNNWGQYYQVKIWFKRIANHFDPDRFNEKLVNSLKGIKPTPVTYKKTKRELLVVPHITDSHFGKVSLDEYGNIDTSLKKTSDHYKSIIDDVLSRVDNGNIDRFLLPVGNDLLNIDSPAKMTTAGTPQPAGDLWENMLVCAETCLIEVIERLKQIAPVDVVMVRGNHDSNSTYTIGRTLWAYFAKDKNVTITNSGKYIEYYTYKDILIALLHGHTVRLNEIDRIISHEAREAWGKAKLVEAILGHFHHENVKTNVIKLQEHLRMRGVTVRVGDTNSGLDEWHRAKNYSDVMQRTQTFVYSSDRIEDIIYSYVKK
jgi:hypothetical protein